MFTRKYGVAILSTLWSVILIGVGIAFWKLYKTSHAVASHPQGLESGSKSPA
jgi:hypothetical protein